MECAFGGSPKEMVLVAPQVIWKDGKIHFMHPELRITKQIEQVDEFSKSQVLQTLQGVRLVIIQDHKYSCLF